MDGQHMKERRQAAPSKVPWNLRWRFHERMCFLPFLQGCRGRRYLLPFARRFFLFYSYRFVSTSVLFRFPRLSSCSSRHVFIPSRPIPSPLSCNLRYLRYLRYPLGPMTEQRCDGNGAGHQARRHGPEGEPAAPLPLGELASHAFPRGHYRQPRGRIRGNRHRTTNTTPRVLVHPFFTLPFLKKRTGKAHVRAQVLTCCFLRVRWCGFVG